MNKLKLIVCLSTVFLLFSYYNVASAGEVEILAADFKKVNEDHWAVSVTLKHDDTGWDHYADGWQLVDIKGNVLGHRILHHPHVNEQPFTRSLGSVVIPKNNTMVIIKAHDKVHGWSSNQLQVDISKY